MLKVDNSTLTSSQDTETEDIGVQEIVSATGAAALESKPATAGEI